MKDFLVQLANESETIRDYLGCKDWKNIVKITDNSVHRFVGMKDGVPQFQARIYGKRKDLGVSNIMMRFAQDSVFQHLDSKYKYSEDLMFKSIWKPQLVKYASASFNPDADPESTSVDGRVGRFVYAGEDWTNLRTGAGTQNSHSIAQDNLCFLRAVNATDKWQTLQRGIFLFDTSSLSGATVNSGTIKFYVVSYTDDFSESCGIVGSTPASNTTLVNADYGELGTTRYATDLNLSSLSTSAYNTWTLNSTGISAIDSSSITKFGTRLGGDIDNSTPTWVSNNQSVISVYYADNGSNEPTLDVNYAGGVSPGNMFHMF